MYSVRAKAFEFIHLLLSRLEQKLLRSLIFVDEAKQLVHFLWIRLEKKNMSSFIFCGLG